ncbi:AbiH family protein, partial [Bacteroides heparinolyticus]|uniref:AbiH family protein n=1 Tax=Prevotella heparinolytica TaxID=28113 RepID=UPI0023F378FB
MNRLVIIGNGFDMAHGLKTSYMDFINWYWEQRLFGSSGISSDGMLKKKTAE